MRNELVDQQQRAHRHLARDDLPCGQVFVGDVKVPGLFIALGPLQLVPEDLAAAMAAAEHLEGPVDPVGINQRNPGGGLQRVLGTRCQVGRVLVPGDGCQRVEGRLGTQVPDRVPGDLRPQDLLDHLQQFHRPPQIRQRLAQHALDVDEHRGPGELLFQFCQPRVDAFPRVRVADLTGRVELPGQIVDQFVDPPDHGLQLPLGEKVPHNQKTVVSELAKLGIGKPHGLGSSLAWLGRRHHCSTARNERVCFEKHRRPTWRRPGPR